MESKHETSPSKATGSEAPITLLGGRGEEDDEAGNAVPVGIPAFQEHLGKASKIPLTKERGESYRELGELAAASHGKEELLSLAKGIQDPSDLLEFISGAMGVLAQSSPAAAVELAALLPPSPVRGALVAEALEYLAAESPRVAVEEAMRLLTGLDRNNGLISVMEAWGRTNASEAMAWALNEAPASTRASAIESVAVQWARTDPAGALESLGGLEGGEELEMVASAVLGTWSQADPEAAYQWITQNSDRFESTRPLEVTLLNWAAFDPVRVSTVVESLAGSEVHGFVVPYVAGSWAGRNPEAALDFARRQTDENLRRNAVGNAIESWASYDSRSAISAALSIPATDATRSQAVGAALAQALAQNPESFTTLLESVPAEHRDELIRIENSMRSENRGDR